MKNAMSKRVIALVMMGSIMGTTVAQAAEVKKDESVYVTLDSTGNLEKTIVSDWIHSEESGITVFDKSELKNIKNVKSDVEPEKNGENLIWDMDGNNLYYQGTTNKDVPLDVSIKYYYEDEEIDPEDLAGKSGKVKIEIDVKNKEYKEVDINGKKRKIYTPFVVAGEVTLPNDKFKDVSTEGATTISEGNNILVAFAKMPGLSESLELDSIPFDKANEFKNKADILNDKKIVVEADAEEFSLGPIMITATADTSMLGDLDGSVNITELKDKLDLMQSSYNQILEGENQIRDGIVNGYAEAKSKIGDAVPRVQGMVDLIKSPEQVRKANELLDDAYTAIGMPTDKLQAGLEFLQNPRMANQLNSVMNSLDKMTKNYKVLHDLKKDGELQKLLTGGNYLLDNYNTINNFSQSTVAILNNEETMAELNSLISEMNNMESNYAKLTPETKQVLKVLTSSITPENLNAIKSMTNELTPVQENLKNAINNAGGVDKFVASLRNSLSTLGTLSQTLSQVDFTNIKADISNYGSAYLVIRSELMYSAATGTLETKKAELKNSVSAIYKSSPELVTQLQGAIDKFANDLTPQAIQKDCEKAQKNLATLEGLSQGVNYLKSVMPLLNQINALTSDEAKLKSVLNILTGNNKVMANLTALANAVNSLPQDQQAILIGMVNNLGSTMNYIDSNTEHIEKINALISKYLSPAEIEKVNAYAKQLSDARGTVEKLKSLDISVNDLPDIEDADFIKIKGLANEKDNLLNMSNQLFDIQGHLKNDEDVLKIMRNSLEKENVDEARKMLNELPSYQSKLDELNSGIQQLSDGMQQFKNEAIDELHNKGTEGFNVIDELSLAKDEITKVSKDYGCFSGQDESVKGSTKFIMKTKEIKYEAPKEEEKNAETTEKKGFFAWIKSLFGID